MANELACYIRLSHADDDLDSNQYESSSISNQRELIHNYLASHPEFDRWKIQEFVDDGYSGTSENRPEFQRMIRLARQGKIQCIIVKDFSRFARNYIIVGDYIEQIRRFQPHCCRIVVRMNADDRFPVKQLFIDIKRYFCFRIVKKSQRTYRSGR